MKKWTLLSDTCSLFSYYIQGMSKFKSISEPVSLALHVRRMGPHLESYFEDEILECACKHMVGALGTLLGDCGGI